MARWRGEVWGVVAVVAAVAAVVVGYQRPDLLAGVLAPRDLRDCRGLVGATEERLDACLADLHAPDLSDGMVKALKSLGQRSRVVAIGRVELPGIEFTPMDQVPGLRRALLDRDEAAVAALLRDAGIHGMVVSRDLTLALDRDATVLSRLAQHDFLEWHQLVRASRELLVYDLRETTMRVPIGDGEALLTGLRQRLAGERPTPQSWRPNVVRLIGGLRLQGNLLAFRHSGTDDIETTLDDLADRLNREWARRVETDGHGALRDRLDDVRLEVWVIMERATVEPRDRDEIFELWELGVDGVMLHREGVEPDLEQFSFYPGSEAVTRSLLSPDAFLRHAAYTFRWGELRPWETDPRVQLELFRSQHFVESERGGGRAVYLFRGAPEVAQASIDDRAVQRMLVEGAEWWVHNQFDDGSFEYKYWPEQNRRSDEYNEVRHILGARDLADAWRYRADPRYLDASQRSMAWLTQFAVLDTDPPDARLPHPPAGSLLFRYPSRAMAEAGGGEPNQKLGTVAVGLLGWLAWARATGSHDEDDRIRRMARFTLSMLEPDGRFRPYLVHAGHPYEHERNDIVPGEAALALGEVAEYFDEPEWVASYGKFVQYYRPWFQSRAARRRPDGRWPHDTYENQDRLDLVQFGPWSVMAAHQVYEVNGDPDAVAFGLEVADWMIDSYLWSAERSPWPDYVGGYYKLPNELPAMQTFCYSEGTAAAWGLARKAAPERAAKYEQATRESIRFLEVMQFDPSDSWYLARPEKVRGGIKYAMNENKVRIDYVGHGLSTLVQFLDVRAEEGGLAIEDPVSYAARPIREAAAGPAVAPTGDRGEGEAGPE